MRWLASVLLASALATGCYTGRGAHAAVDATRVDRKVNVVLTEVDGNIFKLTVFNLSDEPMVVDRDAVYLVAPGGEREKRLPGGIAHSYAIGPHSAHDVNVKFDLTRFDSGQRIGIDVSPAILLDGQHLEMDPIECEIN